MKNILIVIVFLFFSKFSFCQEEKDLNSPKISINIAPISLLDIYDGSSIRGGFEMPITKTLSLGLHGGSYIKAFNFAVKKKPTGYLLNPELKYYYTIKSKTKRYFAVSYLYKNQNYQLSDSIEIEANRFYKKYSMHRKVNVISLKYGEVVNYNHRLFWEWYVGAGIRILKSTSNLSLQEQNGVFINNENDDEMSKRIVRKIGNFNTLNFVVGINFGIFLGVKKDKSISS